MATTEEMVQRLRESRPPATDTFTYLTIVEQSLTPETLPAMQEILDDAELTAEIGWDMVEMLVAVPGSEECLERVARLGNPREVILKVLEVMELPLASKDDGAAADREIKTFVTLVGMLGILHSRLKVSAPSRFLHTTLDTVYREYEPTSPEATAAILDLVRALSTHKRPALPTRGSSVMLDSTFQDSDRSTNAPDPEASKPGEQDAAEPELMNRLLQSFITCVIEAYANSNNMEWAARLLEYTYPERIVPRRVTMLQAFKDVEELQAKDALVGQLAAAAGDVGLSRIPPDKMRQLLEAPLVRNPLLVEEVDPRHPDAIKLSTGGIVCLAAYWMFAQDIFDAHYDAVDMKIFPDHHLLLQRFLGDEPQAQIVANPGTVEALIMMAVRLEAQSGIAGEPSGTEGGSVYMSYHHLLTLVSVFHPNIRVRNAATVMAGHVLHADPEEDDRLGILQDLLENCMFSSLQACAVTWLREEIVAARKAGTGEGRFASSDCIDTLQYALFPPLTDLLRSDGPALLEFWTQNAPFHLQAANFVLFLLGGDYKDLAPAGIAAAVEHRYVEPLVHVADTLAAALAAKEVDAGGPEAEAEIVGQLAVLKDALRRAPLL